MLKLFPTIEFAVTKFFAASCCTSKFPYKREAGNAGTNIKKRSREIWFYGFGSYCQGFQNKNWFYAEM